MQSSQSQVSKLQTCAEFLIEDPRLGDPKQYHATPRQLSKLTIDIFQPIREGLIRHDGYPISQFEIGSPWGAGITCGKGKVRVSVYFTLIPSIQKTRWEGSIMTNEAPPFWREITGLRDRSAEVHMIEQVATDLKHLIANTRSFHGVRWITDEQFCNTAEYKDI